MLRHGHMHHVLLLGAEVPTMHGVLRWRFHTLQRLAGVRCESVKLCPCLLIENTIELVLCRDPMLNERCLGSVPDAANTASIESFGLWFGAFQLFFLIIAVLLGVYVAFVCAKSAKAFPSFPA